MHIQMQNYFMEYLAPHLYVHPLWHTPIQFGRQSHYDTRPVPSQFRQSHSFYHLLLWCSLLWFQEANITVIVVKCLAAVFIVFVVTVCSYVCCTLSFVRVSLWQGRAAFSNCLEILNNQKLIINLFYTLLHLFLPEIAISVATPTLIIPFKASLWFFKVYILKHK